MTVCYARTIVLDIGSSHGFNLAALRSVDLYRNGTLVPIIETDISYAYSTSDRGGLFGPKNAFITSLSKIGVSESTEFWSADTSVNVRLYCTFYTPIEFDAMVVNNSHDGYGYVLAGVKDLKIYITAMAIESPYDFDTPIPGSTLIFDGVLDLHVADDVEDPQTLTLASFPLEVYAPVFTSPLTVNAVPNKNIYAIPFLMSAEMTTSAQDNTEWLTFIRSQGPFAQKRFYCTITGAQNGLPDIVVAISSFQSRRRSGTPSYLQVVVSGTDQHEAIAARLDGDIIISMAYEIDGSVMFQEDIARSGMDNIDMYIGGRSQSVTISGNRQTNYSTGKAVFLSDVEHTSLISGKRRVRMATPNMFIKPSDTAFGDGYSFSVELITTTVGIGASGSITSSMELSGI